MQTLPRLKSTEDHWRISNRPRGKWSCSLLIVGRGKGGKCCISVGGEGVPRGNLGGHSERVSIDAKFWYVGRGEKPCDGGDVAKSISRSKTTTEIWEILMLVN